MIGINAAVTQERPVAADFLLAAQVAVGQQDFLVGVGEIVGGQRMSTSRPTQTQIDLYGAAAAEFEGTLNSLRQLIEVDLTKLEKQMEAAGAPWTPGRIPEWKDQ